jgi:rhamnogalacturonan endolyase
MRKIAAPALFAGFLAVSALAACSGDSERRDGAGGISGSGGAASGGKAGSAGLGGTAGKASGGGPAAGAAGMPVAGASGAGVSGNSGSGSGTGGAAGAAAGTANGGSSGTSPGGSAGTGTAGAIGNAGTGTGGTGPAPEGFYLMEKLDRGVVAVEVSGGVYVGWRMLGHEYDAERPERVSYRVYRDDELLADVTNSTNYVDESGDADATYSVRAVIDGTVGEASRAVPVWPQNYQRIPLTPPSNSYAANDGSTGDVDGDGIYEIFLKWDPSDAKDNSQEGVTSNVFIDCLMLNGTRRWRIDLGPNIRAGAHYTQFVVQDFDGDGLAEMAVKTAPGTRDGTGAFLQKGPAANDDDSMTYRNGDGYVLSGPEYLTVFGGATGVELATVAFDVGRGTVSSWGDDYGNRVDRFLATAAYLDDTGLPSFIMARGYYTRSTLTAWNYRDGTLSQLWKFDSNETPRDSDNHPYTGQGSHSMTPANVDDDPGQEIMYGAMAVDDDGEGLCSTGYNHGDAEHVSDLVPSRPGLEFFMCNEDGDHPAYHLRDARTCEILEEGPVNGADTGRCVAGDVSDENPGAEMWASSVDGLLSATNNMNVGSKPVSQNFLIYWDADESRELEDGTAITKYGGGTLQSCNECGSNNGTKANPVLTADLLGDWREEIIWRESDNSALRLYTTTAVTERRIYTLMHDPQYRMQVSAEQTAYNQPPHPGFHIGSGMVDPPKPDLRYSDVLNLHR